jgi:hypothetical protein
MKKPRAQHNVALLGALVIMLLAVVMAVPASGASPSTTPDPSTTVTDATAPVASGTAGANGVSVKVAAFQTEPVVLTGAEFPEWTSGPEVTARVPQTPTDYDIANTQKLTPEPLQSDCYEPGSSDPNGRQDPYDGDHNCFQGSQSPVRTVLKGVPTASLRGYRWNPATGTFVQIPFQVDPKWEHYISNNASGFAFYSGVDEMLTYSFDVEPFLFTNAPFNPSDPGAVCQAVGDPTTPDPNSGLIDTDEMAFMARDSGTRAPSTASLPPGIVSANQVLLVDPSTGITRYVYVMESAPGATSSSWAVPIAYTASNSPYVHYQPDADARTYVYSQSSYSNYGNALYGPACTSTGQPVIGQGFKKGPNGSIVLDPSTYVQRRTLDTATVTTPRYKFRYDGRWIMDDLQVSPNDGGWSDGDHGMSASASYGPSIINRFKGRAFQQSPGGSTPCCGYEDEQVNWNGSSITMGVDVGPVRVIRVTWGADSGTNITRTDIFYAYSMEHDYNLRVHPIPPLDGIYTQWDMAAGAITRYYNPENPGGVTVAGINPVLYGDTTDIVGPSGIEMSSNDKVGRAIASLNGGKPLTVGKPDKSSCKSIPLPEVTPSDCIYGSFNVPDVTFSGVGLATEPLSWEELTGPGGTMVEKWSVDLSSNPSPGGAQASLEAVPYYVDDSCFDDGTGNGPGPQVNPRGIDPTTWGFADESGHPVAVSPAPTSGLYPKPVTKDGQTYLPKDEPYQRRCWNHNANGTPYNIPGTATFNPKEPIQKQDPPPDPNFGPQGDVRYFEGDIATHGVHLLLVGDSDNADLTVPVDEIDEVDYQAILPPDEPNIGAGYSEQFLTPIVGVATPFPLTSLKASQPYIAGSGLPATRLTGPAGTGSSNPAAPDSLIPTGISLKDLFPKLSGL